MKTNKQISTGLIITVVIFIISTFLGSKLNIETDLIPNGFLTHTTMLLLSIFVIYSFRKYVNYKISFPEFKKIFKPILSWDWKTYEKLQYAGKFKDIEFQASRMDICHYAFPENLNLLIKGIGQMKALAEQGFEGCGSYNTDIRTFLEKEFLDLNDMLKSLKNKSEQNKDDLIKAWLVACLAKTIKENINISIPIIT